MLSRLTSYRSGARSLLWAVAVIVVTTTVAAAGIATVSAQSASEVMISNMDQEVELRIGQADPTASSFTTGTSTTALEKVRFNIHTFPPSPLVSIWSDVSGEPGAKLHDLTNPAEGDDHRDYTSLSRYVLSANTTYWVVVYIPCTSGGLWFQAFTSTTTPSTAQPGWSFGGDKLRSQYPFPEWRDGHFRYIPPQPVDPDLVYVMFEVYASATSTASAPAATSTPNNPASGGIPSISGTPQVGRELTAVQRCITDADGLALLSYSYQWLADDVEIAGATDYSYIVQPTDVGKDIKVRMSFNDDLGNAEVVTSNGTGPIQAFYLSGITRVRYAENGTSTVATYAATGAATSTITWSLTGRDSDDFSINTSGQLSFSSPPDFESPTDTYMSNVYVVTVNAGDGESTATLNVRVSVTDVNEGPSLMMNQ